MPRRAEAAVFGVALAARGLHLLALRGADLAAVALGDGRGYLAWAAEITGGDVLGSEVFYQAPLYPYFLAAVAALFGPGPWPVRVIQVLLGALACALVAAAGRRFFSSRAGLAAGLLLALYPPAIFFDGVVQKTALAGFLTAALVALLGALAVQPRPTTATVAGVVLGLLALTRENSLILAPIVLAWAALWPRDAARPARGRRALALALGLAAVLLPMALRNLAVGGELVVTTSQLGSNFYIGNRPEADGRYRPLRPGRQDARVERRDAVELAEAAAGRRLTPREVSRFWLGRSLAWIRAEPGAWLGLLAKKAYLVLNAREIADTESLEAYRDASRPLDVLARLLHFGVLLPLAVLGVWASRDRWRRLAVLYATLAALALSLVAFYVMARYRFQLVPILAIFAGAGLVALLDSLRRRTLAPLVPGLALALLAALVSNLPPGVATSPRATTYYNLGVALEEAGDRDGAERALERAVELLPGFAPGHAELARLRAARGDRARAIAGLERALALDPGLVAERFELARLLAESGDADAAVARYRELLVREPGNAAAHHNLGALLLARGELAPAERHLRRALELDPGLALARNLLANLLAARGELDAAVAEYEAALAIDPDLADARFKLGSLLAGAGRLEEARAHLAIAARLLPGFPEARRRLAEVEERLAAAGG